MGKTDMVCAEILSSLKLAELAAASLNTKKLKTRKIVRMKEGRGECYFAVQCEKCFKWRLIETTEKYEEIRSKIDEDPFICDKKAHTSCQTPTDIVYNSSHTWASDKPNIPKTPKGFERNVTLRKDFSRTDVSYITPEGEKIRSMPHMKRYLEAHPEYKDVSASNFCFIAPKVMRDTVPCYVKN